MKVYAGVGSRQTPAHIISIMIRVARRLAVQGWTLRSGGAVGADVAFEAGAVNGAREIFHASDCTPEAMEVAAATHPAWDRCGAYARRLHGRNAFQVLGRDLRSPVAFVLCWTPDGCIHHSARTRATGGTGTAISIASLRGIPVFNLARADHLARVTAMVA